MIRIPMLPTLIATAGLALLAACSGSPSSTGSGGSPTAGGAASSQLVAYSQCMRSNGVRNFPDPTSAGPPKVSAQELGVTSSRLQAAQGACQHLLPVTGALDQQAQQCFTTGSCPQALVQRILAVERRFAQCMRSHGAPKWPDPSIDSEGRPVFAISISKDGFDPHSQFNSQQDECGRMTGSPEPRAISP